MIIDSIRSAGIELPPVVVDNGETPGRAGSADIVVRAIGLTPRITHPGRDIVFLVVDRYVVGGLRQVEQITAPRYDICRSQRIEDGRRSRESTEELIAATKLLLGQVGDKAEPGRPTQLVFEFRKIILKCEFPAFLLGSSSTIDRRRCWNTNSDTASLIERVPFPSMFQLKERASRLTVYRNPGAPCNTSWMYYI